MRHTVKPSLDLIEVHGLTDEEMTKWRDFLQHKSIFPVRVFSEFPWTEGGVRFWNYSACFNSSQSQLVLDWIEQTKSSKAA